MKKILHCDANNFYASVEVMLDSSLNGKPVAVSGNIEKRHGIILAKNYIAKQFGVSTGEAIWEAKLKCPNLVCVLPHMEEYNRISKQIFNIYTEYTDRVEPFGIDECWLDVTNSQKLFGDATTIANTIRERVKAEIGITISVGVSFTKIFAKLGSDLKKPDATTVIDENNYKTLAWALPVSDLLMVGKKTLAVFNKLNIKTIGDLANYDDGVLSYHLGINGKKLKNYANGIEDEDVKFCYQWKVPDSVGHSTTLPKDITQDDEVKSVLMALSEMIATRLRKYGLRAKGITLGVKTNDLNTLARQKKLDSYISNSTDIFNLAFSIYKENCLKHATLPIRALSISTHDLNFSFESTQTNMFGDNSAKKDNLEVSIDKIRNKYGYSCVKKGIVMQHKDLTEDLQ
ncbi:MAG: DNA polymerase IV [Clostridia bacterium]